MPAKTVIKKSEIIKGETILKDPNMSNTVLYLFRVCTYIDKRGINIVSFLVAR